jgi:hypothetical protein
MGIQCGARRAAPGQLRSIQNDTSLLILDYGWGENRSPLTATLSRSGSGAAAPTGLLPPLLPPPLRGALTPVSLVQLGYHLPLPLAGYQSLCVCSQLCASALCF